VNIEKQVNSISIKHQELIEVTERVHELPEEDKDFEGRSILLIKMFPGEPDKVMAIDLRIRAMGDIIDSHVLPGWTMPEQPDGCQMISEPVWIAAAEEPLLFENDKAFFDEEKFKEKVLSCAKSEGSA
jgi:hypothetical protein